MCSSSYTEPDLKGFSTPAEYVLRGARGPTKHLVVNISFNCQLLEVAGQASSPPYQHPKLEIPDRKSLGL